MSTELTKDERLCLQMWFRQAIAKLEREEVTTHFIQNRDFYEQGDDSHRNPVFRRRAPRSRKTTHTRELVY